MKLLKNLRTNETLQEFLTGIGLYGGVCLAAALIFSERKLYAVIGLVIGLLAAVFYVLQLYHAIDASLDYDEKGAAACMRKNFLIRYLVVAAVAVLTAVTDIGSIFTCFAGILGVKLGAYLQPFVRRHFFKRIDPPAEPLPEDIE
ncbi:MAG: hypothetical protein K6G83_12715 [Lachnospiraceae bacterium]|nr:hypothetical protein [Lachnospiraceae bacterium]